MIARPDVLHPPPTVLVADDEPGIRALIQRLLEREGFRVLCVGSGEAATELTATLDRPPDLLILDLGLLGRNGEDLAARLLAGAPRLPLLFISGRAEALEPGHLPAPVLGKPFSPDELIRIVRQLLREWPTSRHLRQSGA